MARYGYPVPAGACCLMSLLSDLTIRAYMPRSDLVRDGDPKRAEGCGYTVVPGLATPTGPGAMPVDFSAERRELVVVPGQMVWVRSP